jgi:hypothetical protein
MSMESDYSRRIEDAFRILLESKHLYQNVLVDLSTYIPRELKSNTSPRRITNYERWTSYHQNNWIVINTTVPASDQSMFFNVPNSISFRPPDIKSFCSKCDRVEPYNYIGGMDFLTLGNAINEVKQYNSLVTQTFVLSYRCQSCELVPEVFIIRREGPKLILSGRAPIEHIDVPKIIPKSVAKFYSSAIVAYQSGQTLAANFMLRTILEQFANTKAQNPKDADDAINQYMDDLPDDFKSRFPSFRDIYSTLSSDIHNALGSTEVFEESKAKIIKHFEARKVYEL